MAHFIQHAQRIEIITHSLVFDLIADPNCGLGFDCDSEGILNKPLALCDRAIENLLQGIFSGRYGQPRIEERRHSYRESAVILCDCGGKHGHVEVVLDDPMTNTCGSCGQFYNGSGQRLSHPRFWGEETGERFTDSGAAVL